MKIDILMADNDYGVTRVFARGFARALERLGVRVRSFYITDDSFYKASAALVEDPADLTLSFSHIRVEDRPFAEYAPRYHLTWILDRGYFFLDLAPPPKSLIAVIDELDKKLFECGAPGRVLFLAHAAEREFVEMPLEEEKDLDLVFFGTHLSSTFVRDRWSEKFSPKERELLEECCERTLRESDTPLLTLLLQSGCAEKLPLFFSEGDFYLRSREREALLAEIDRPSLHIFGKGNWGQLIKRGQVHGEISFSEAKEVMRRSKIVLNASLTLKYGLHERILYGAGALSSVITSKTAGFEKFFKDKAGFYSFTYGEWPELFQTIDRLLANEPMRLEQAKQAQKEVLDHHTFDNRAKALVDWLNTLGLSSEHSGNSSLQAVVN